MPDNKILSKLSEEQLKLAQIIFTKGVILRELKKEEIKQAIGLIEKGFFSAAFSILMNKNENAKLDNPDVLERFEKAKDLYLENNRDKKTPGELAKATQEYKDEIEGLLDEVNNREEHQFVTGDVAMRYRDIFKLSQKDSTYRPLVKIMDCILDHNFEGAQRILYDHRDNRIEIDEETVLSFSRAALLNVIDMAQKLPKLVKGYNLPNYQMSYNTANIKFEQFIKNSIEKKELFDKTVEEYRSGKPLTYTPPPPARSFRPWGDSRT